MNDLPRVVERGDPARRYWSMGGALLLVFALSLTLASFSFVHGEGFKERPIVLVVVLLLVAGMLHALASFWAWRHPPPFRLVLWVAAAARALLLPSTPIQEDDIYRYLWDGRVVAAGLDPYRFSPGEIEEFERGALAAAPEDIPLLSRLVLLKREHPAVETIFKRINNREHATIYPAWSQAIFWLHGAAVPASWPLPLQVSLMKGLFCLFDLGALAILGLLLKEAGAPAGLCVLYGWCPLLLKEVANSGHMDAVPAFFIMAALWALGRRRPFACGLALGAAAAAKFYALLLVPLLLKALGRRRAWLMLGALFVVAIPGGLLFPESAGRRGQTLLEFALVWENHDAAFLWLKEAWSWLPMGEAPWQVPGPLAPVFLEKAHGLALISVLVLLGALLAGQTWKASSTAPLGAHLERAFLILASLFLLSPIGFPWYFIPCLPLSPWARQRSWVLLPGLLMVYYLRFWYEYHFPGQYKGFAGGADFFDHVIVSAEFGFFLLILSIECLRKRPWRRPS